MRDTEVITVDQTGPPILAQTTPENLIAIALQNGAGIEQMDKLFDLQLRFEENELKKQDREAKKAYIAAMAEFKSSAPTILKDKNVKYKKQNNVVVDYDHASIGNVVMILGTALGNFGLSAGWKTTQEKGKVTVRCTVTHKGGHSDFTELFAPPDASGGKNEIQAICSTVSYLERYTLLAITGCATMDQKDDDGRSHGGRAPQKISVDRFKEGINFYKTPDHSADDLDKWFSGKGDSLELLNKAEQEEVEKHLKDIFNWLDANGKFAAPPKTFKCHSGLEVVVTDCAQCPSREGCKELKEFKENN